MGKSGGIVSQDLSTRERFIAIQKYYRNFVDDKLIQKVFGVFKLDFELFNYGLNDFVGSSVRVEIYA